MWQKMRLLQMSEREKTAKNINKKQIDKSSGTNKWSN